MRYILAIALVLQVWIGLSDAIAGGYVNCFSENIRQRHFSVSPGSYNPDKMEPNYCRERCGAFDYLYAALAHGKFCFCSQTLPVGKNVTNTPCNMTCEGNPSEICGSRNYVSVFRSISAITGLEVTSNVSGILTVPASIGLSISVNSGNNILYMVDYGDTSGSTVGNETDYDSRQIYRPGQYVVKVGAQDVDKTMPVSYAVTGFTLEQTVESVDILCDPAFATYEEGECVVTVWKGTDLMMDANFTDRHPYDVRLEYIADPIVSIAGTWVPNPPNTTPSTGAYVMRAAEFTTSGKIYGWRMHVQTAGQIKIYVLSPSCTTTSTTYCYESNSCKASCLTTSKAISTACSASDAFCGQSGKCYATCSSTASRYGTTQINVDSYVINQTITFNPTTTGTKWFDQSPYLDVEPGFVLGVDHSVTGRISEMSAPINDIKFTSASFSQAGGTLYTSTHALQAYYSSGSKVLLKFTFLNNPIIFPMDVTVYNRKQATTATNTTYINLFEGVDFAIIEGPEYVAANEPALFTLANHTGSNLTYIWNITDGSPIGSLPYLNHTFLAKGDYNISVAVFNVISRKDNYTTVHVQDRITGLVITAVDSPVNTLVNLNVALATGSDFTCKLNYGDGNPPVDLTPLEITIPTSVQTHEYLDIGFYTLVIFCENMINNATSKVDIYIEEPITNLRAAREGAPTLEAFRFGWLLDSGSNVIFQLTFNGASLAIDPAASDVNSYVWESVIVPGKPANGYPYFLQFSEKYWKVRNL
ncbi:uncharacterized protein LOC131938737 [Physella acuta]|uniref:uncharacterized protein LOC131938737 n=1 Tax=Physella acuta TaxID=109671 RepID=UPI0027DD3B89|nr:uncharacterized protein LOC131938737 [Physella acuta]